MILYEFRSTRIVIYHNYMFLNIFNFRFPETLPH